MKTPVAVVIVLLLIRMHTANGQDIPLFSQKLTNSFIYNPALAGHTFGSMTFSYKENYSQVEGAPKNYFLSIHAPLANHKFGIGGNIFLEEVTFLRNTYLSTAAAYHIHFNRFSSLSFGVSGEYNSLMLNGVPIGQIDDPEYSVLLNGGMKKYDVSFGTHYQNRFLKAGLAVNRLSSTWLQDTASFANYFSAFVQGSIPMRNGEDVLEPYVAYRKLSDINNTIDVGLFYTYDNKITAGASYRNGGIVSGTLAFRLSKYLLIGYSREMIMGNVGGFVGAANEFTIRYDFNNSGYKERFRADYKSALAFRRKTISSAVGKSGSRDPKQMRKKQKKIAPYSPNRRYQNIKKLSIKSPHTKKKKSAPKKHPARKRR